MNLNDYAAIIHEELTEAGEIGKVSKKDARTLITAAFKDLPHVLFKDADSKLTIVGMGAFSFKDVPARTVRNPQTGKPLDVPAKRKFTFKASSTTTQTM